MSNARDCPPTQHAREKTLDFRNARRNPLGARLLVCVLMASSMYTYVRVCAYLLVASFSARKTRARRISREGEGAEKRRRGWRCLSDRGREGVTGSVEPKARAPFGALGGDTRGMKPGRACAQRLVQASSMCAIQQPRYVPSVVALLRMRALWAVIGLPRRSPMGDDRRRRPEHLFLCLGEAPGAAATRRATRRKQRAYWRFASLRVSDCAA